MPVSTATFTIAPNFVRLSLPVNNKKQKKNIQNIWTDIVSLNYDVLTSQILQVCGMYAINFSDILFVCIGLVHQR